MGSVSAWSETVSINKKRVIKELVNGQECANQLQILFHNWSEKSERLSAEELVHKIFTSFNHILSMLTCLESAEVSQNQPTSYNDCPQDSTKSSRKKRPACRDKRGCYKRKKAEKTWTLVSETVEDDGHAWRKYGQKQILNSDYPRGYFRCTRKYDQGCKATKQVQRMDDDSQMYQITYIGTHTCRPDSFKAPQIIKDSESCESYKMVTYGNSKIQSKNLLEPRFNPSNTPTVQQEAKEETMTTSGVTDMDSMLMWKDIIGADYGDVVSNVYSSTDITSLNLELDLVINPVEFEDDFDLDETEFRLV